VQENNSKTISLRELQLWMRWIFVDPRGVDTALKIPYPKGERYFSRYIEPRPSAFPFIKGIGHTAIEERLSIYAEGYFSRILDAVDSDFATTKRILGTDLFNKLMADYLKEYPSHTTNIGEIGKNLPRFVGHYYLQEDLPYLADTVSLEWNIVESFYANENAKLDMKVVSQMNETSWAHSEILLDSSVKLMSLNWPVDELWRNRGRPEFSEIELALSYGQTNLLIYRTQGDVYVDKVSAPEFKILSLLKEGSTLIEAISKIEDREVESLMSWFGRWTRVGIISDIKQKGM